MMLCLAVLSFISCKKEADVLVKEGTFTGKWDLIKTSGTITGNGISTDWNTIEFDGKSAYFGKDSEARLDGAFITVDEVKKTILFAFPTDLGRTLDLRFDPNKSYEFDGESTLYLNSDCCDRVNYELRKKP